MDSAVKEFLFFIGLRGELGFYCFSGELICDLIAARTRATRKTDYDFPSMALGAGIKIMKINRDSWSFNTVTVPE